MNYNFEEITYPSSDGIHTVYAELYTPKNKTAKGIVQLVHGMKDYVTRYTELADYLTGEGYIFAGNHHLGHGRTASAFDDYGFFTDEDGARYLLDDMHAMNRHLRHTFPALPLFMLGHSMGSFAARLYVAEHQHSTKGLIILGTGGTNPLLPLGKAVVKMLTLFKGVRHRSSLVTSLAFGGFNRKFPSSDGKEAWLTSEPTLVKDREGNKYNDFIFTLGGYRDLFDMMGRSNSRAWYNNYPKNIPALVISGDMDPVGNYGKGPKEVYKGLVLSGASDVTLKLYEGARHELFNDKCREEFFSDIVKWLDSHAGM